KGKGLSKITVIRKFSVQGTVEIAEQKCCAFGGILSRYRIYYELLQSSQTINGECYRRPDTVPLSITRWKKVIANDGQYFND
ncbi:hypothetical protein ALC62_10928, partial [Cyphomyrmex costatus]